MLVEHLVQDRVFPTIQIFQIPRSLKHCRNRAATLPRWMSKLTISLRTKIKRVSIIFMIDGLNIVERKWLWAFPQIEGVPPAPRGGHSATLTGASLVIFGVSLRGFE